MSDLAVIGDRDTIMGFRALGLETHAFSPAETLDAEKITPRLRDIVGSGTKILFVTEAFYQSFADLLERLRGQSVLPLFVPIPGNQGSLGVGVRKVEDLVEKAIGADIFAQDKK